MNAVEVAEPANAESLAVQCVSSALQDPIATQRESLVHKAAIKALKGGKHDALFRLLEIVSTGSVSDYEAFHAAHPGAVSAAGLEHTALLRAMRLLTLCSACSTKASLSYAEVAEAISVPEADVESWLIDGIDAKVIDVQINEADKAIAVLCVPRKSRRTQPTRAHPFPSPAAARRRACSARTSGAASPRSCRSGRTASSPSCQPCRAPALTSKCRPALPTARAPHALPAPIAAPSRGVERRRRPTRATPCCPSSGASCALTTRCRAALRGSPAASRASASVRRRGGHARARARPTFFGMRIFRFIASYTGTLAPSARRRSPETVTWRCGPAATRATAAGAAGATRWGSRRAAACVAKPRANG